jgi:hypothetical protein
MAEGEKQNGAAQEQDERNERNEVGRKSKMIEQDPNDIPHKDQSQVPDINPGKVQPGHRDREQV